jgi:hypothetical protein
VAVADHANVSVKKRDKTMTTRRKRKKRKRKKRKRKKKRKKRKKRKSGGRISKLIGQKFSPSSFKYT